MSRLNPTKTSTAEPPAPTATQLGGDPLPGRKLVFFIVAMALFMASVDQTVVATALSSIQQDLDAGIEWSSWTITIYALGQVLIMPLAGKFSDLFGRKKVFLTAAILFTAASLCCGLVDNIYLLVVLRGIQSIGGGAFLPSATGIVADHFGRERDRALGMFTSIFPIGGIIGPVLGGFFVTYWSWRGIFLVNVPIGIVLILLCIIFIPESKRQASTKRIDIPGVILLGVLILSTMLGITYLGSAGSSPLSVRFILPEMIAVIALLLFLRHAKVAPAPFIPIRMLRGRGFGVMNLINFLHGCAALGFGALVPLYAETRFNIPTLQAGTLLTARAVGMICVAGLAVMALRRTGYRLPMVMGFSVLALGQIWMAFYPFEVSPFVWLAIGAAFSGIGMGLALPAANNAILQLAPTEVAGIAGMRGMFRQSGAIMSVSIVTAIVARSADPGATLAHALLVFAGILIVILPLVRLVPEHKGTW